MSLIQSLLAKLSGTRQVVPETPGSSPAPFICLVPPPLEELAAQRQFVEVYFEGSHRAYQSLILSIDQERGIIWFDDLFPQQKMLEPGSQLEFCYRTGERILNFQARVIACGEKFGVKGFAISCPQNLGWRFRRKHQRLELYGASSLSVKIRAFNDDARYGSIENLSAGGMCILLAGSLEQSFHHGDEIPLCEFMLENTRVQTSARVRGLTPNRTPYRGTRIHLEFLTLSLDKQAKIDAFISKQRPLKNFQQDAA